MQEPSDGDAIRFPVDPITSAHAAGLRHVDPEVLAGLTRVKRGMGFAYADPGGRLLQDRATLERIRKLVIPPAWTQVWICPFESGHIQAVGRDARGRKQYRYHAQWRTVRDATKYHRMLAFGAALPRIRKACLRDVVLPGLPREKVLATAVRLLELTHIRIGHEAYTRENGSYGLTTLRDRHVDVHGGDMKFHFRGKGGKMRVFGVHDSRLARIVAACSELPGHELFKYRAEDGSLHLIDSALVNEYIGHIGGGDFTAKDFRTWAATAFAARILRAIEPCRTRGKANKNVVDCVRQVAARLGNTPAICKKCYVHPAIVDAYLAGTLHATRAKSDESLVIRILSRAERMSESQKLNRALEASLHLARVRKPKRRA